ncbi:GntR family transcriptional regulator [Streptomyces platensis]|uniref:GntR family transcriptional regulator n=1 Tax=Streptomyces platensis TaxID=58346 RepID=UPI00224E6F8B|nr:GntR family transcriptional regulator [Streptomyces platensis]MCX4640836.1 GntR family transcriptional regulator [Streptomyces platensis]
MTPPSQHDPRPPYQQAADEIRGDIEAGRLKPGQQLPSHRELQERFNIANMTARSALRVLREEGLIYTVQGRGSYVADKPGEHSGDAEAARVKPPQKVEADPEDGQATGPVTEALHALQDQLRTLNAEFQDLRKEVDALKAERQS